MSRSTEAFVMDKIHPTTVAGDLIFVSHNQFTAIAVIKYVIYVLEYAIFIEC